MRSGSRRSERFLRSRAGGGCYEAVGFRRVGAVRSYWWDHVEERWADDVLLDLLADELQ